jgi:hypothetical protein
MLSVFAGVHTKSDSYGSQGKSIGRDHMAKSKKSAEDATNLNRIIDSIDDGRAIVLSYARELGLTDNRYRDFIRDYDADKKIDLGVLCERHKIPPAEFLADVNKIAFSVTDEAMLLSKAISTKIVAAHLPKVVKRGMLEGAKADGIADRHFTLQQQGFHVAPKGVNISMNQVNQQQAGLPSFEDDTKDLANILADVDGEVVEDRLLTEGTTEYVSEIEHDLEEVPA